MKLDYENLWKDAQQMIKHLTELVRTQEKLSSTKKTEFHFVRIRLLF